MSSRRADVLNGFIERSGPRARWAAARALPSVESEQAQSMQRLVEDLLTLSALESEAIPDAEADVCDGPIAVRACGERQGALGRAACRQRRYRHPACHGSRDELASAFGNLVSTRCVTHRRGGRSGWRGQSTTKVEGCSASPTRASHRAEHIPRLTERFYRVDRSRSRAPAAPGSPRHRQARAAAHQQRSIVTSEPGKGSTFAG